MNRVSFAIGLAFGFLLAAARLHEYDVIHKMLLLQELDVFFLMASAIGTAAPLLWLLQRRGWRTPWTGPLRVYRAPVTRNNLLGSSVFGAGWAVAGTCPGPAVVMTAGGTVLGGVVMVGLLTGVVVRDRVAAHQVQPADLVKGPEVAAAEP